MSCRDYDHYIQLYVDQEISEADRRKLLEHTRTCSACRRELQEMVTLVTSMEDVRQEMRAGTPVLFRGFFKWMAVCSVAVSFAFVLIPLFSQKTNTSEGDLSPAQPMQHSVMVLAAQEESLFIPNDQFVHVIHPGNLQEEGFKSEATIVYPSAVSYFTEKNRTWSDYTQRFVFIRVPDEQTLLTLLSYAGAKIEQLTGITNLDYPTSIMINLGDVPEYEVFTFPEEKQDMRDLLDKITSKATISEQNVSH